MVKSDSIDLCIGLEYFLRLKLYQSLDQDKVCRLNAEV